ncbi:hypothetical protein ACJX0J_021693, partial [Zea mays]
IDMINKYSIVSNICSNLFFQMNLYFIPIQVGIQTCPNCYEVERDLLSMHNWSNVE